MEYINTEVDEIQKFYPMAMSYFADPDELRHKLMGTKQVFAKYPKFEEPFRMETLINFLLEYLNDNEIAHNSIAVIVLEVYLYVTKMESKYHEDINLKLVDEYMSVLIVVLNECLRRKV